MRLGAVSVRIAAADEKEWRKFWADTQTEISPQEIVREQDETLAALGVQVERA